MPLSMQLEKTSGRGTHKLIRLLLGIVIPFINSTTLFLPLRRRSSRSLEGECAVNHLLL
jgi:hypothetical protein